MGGIWTVLAIAAGVVSLVCWVMTLIKIFKDGKIGLGIVSIICGIVAFVYGWMKVNEYNHKTVMMIWTIAFVVSILANVIGGASMMSQFQQ